MAAWKTDETGNWVIHKCLHLGTRGPNGARYMVENISTGKVIPAETVAYAKCVIANQRDNRRFEPYFSTMHSCEEMRAEGNIKDYKMKLVAHDEYQEITG